MTLNSFTKLFPEMDGKYLYWTDDVNKELPIIITEGDKVPIKTIPQVFKEVASKIPHKTALKV
jgi:hypothetical protein